MGRISEAREEVLDDAEGVHSVRIVELWAMQALWWRVSGGEGGGEGGW